MGYRSGNDAHVLFLRVHRRGLHCAIHLRGEPGVCDGIEIEMSELAHVLPSEISAASIDLRQSIWKRFVARVY